MLEVLPVNFRLQSDEEQSRIINSFAAWLKVAPDNLQILSVAQTVDIDAYANRMHGFLEQESDTACRELIEDNIAEVRYLANVGAVATRFFIAFRFEAHMRIRADTFEAVADALYDAECTARSYLSRCGLEIMQPDYSDNFVCGVVYSLLCKRTSQRQRLPLYFRTMLQTIHGLTDEMQEGTDVQA